MEHRQEETTVQYLTMNATHQLVTDHRAAVAATARRGRVRRMLARAAGPSTAAIDLAAVETADAPTPAVILRASTTASTADAGRVDKVA
jgi:hypothetical protein